MPTWKSVPVDSTYALTTIFTAPQWCSSVLYTWHPLTELPAAPSIFFRAQLGQKHFNNKYAECYPPNFAEIAALQYIPYKQTVTKFWDVATVSTIPDRGIYSPGVCPSGWSSWSVSTSTGWYNCCPLGFSWEDWEACKSRPTTATVVALNAQSETTMVHPPYILAEWPMLIAYASSDLDDFHPASAPLLLHKINKESNSSGSDRLSTGTKAGIGVGVAVACVALIALLLTMLLLRRRRRTRDRQGAVNEGKSKKERDLPAQESSEAVDNGPESANRVEASEITEATNTSTSVGVNYAIDNTAGLHRRTTM